MEIGVPGTCPGCTYQTLSATQIRLFTVDEGDYGATASGELETVRMEPGGESQSGFPNQMGGYFICLGRPMLITRRLGERSVPEGDG